MLRCFDDDNVIHVDGRINPVSDKEIIDTELQLKDLDSVEKKISKSEKTAKFDKDALSGRSGVMVVDIKRVVGKEFGNTGRWVA